MELAPHLPVNGRFVLEESIHVALGPLTHHHYGEVLVVVRKGHRKAKLCRHHEEDIAMSGC